MIDLSLSPEHELLVTSAKQLLDRHCTGDDVRRSEEDPRGHDAGLWRRMAELGWPGLAVGPEAGGTGPDLLALCLVAEQQGRHACSSPLIDSAALVAPLLASGGSIAQRERWLPGLAGGEEIGTLALLDADGRDEHSPSTLAAPRRPESDGASRHGSPVAWHLSGTKSVVPFADAATVMLVAARLEGLGPSLVVTEAGAPGIEIERRRGLGGDPLFSVLLDLDVTPADVLGEAAPAGAEVLQRALDRVTVAKVAYAAGLADRALEMSVDHACSRQQFGRPIGSFQAVAHRLADARADLDAVRLLAYQAAWTLDQGMDGELEVASAKAFANDAVRRIFEHAHQVHGAIGFSTEHDLPLYSRRAKAFELTLGGTDRHRERAAAVMGLVDEEAGTGPRRPAAASRAAT